MPNLSFLVIIVVVFFPLIFSPQELATKQWPLCCQPIHSNRDIYLPEIFNTLIFQNIAFQTEHIFTQFNDHPVLNFTLLTLVSQSSGISDMVSQTEKNIFIESFL